MDEAGLAELPERITTETDKTACVFTMVRQNTSFFSGMNVLRAGESEGQMQQLIGISR